MDRLERADVVVVGGGLVGLATAHRLLGLRPDLRLTLIEQAPVLAAHQSGHNSGVLHAGLYYAPGSLKARLCREGKAELERFAQAQGIPVGRPGKLVVAVEPGELARLDELERRARANEVPGLERVGPERVRELEPHAAGLAGLWSPTTAVIDFGQVAAALGAAVRQQGATIVLGRRVLAIRDRGAERLVRTSAGDVVARDVVVCAGLQADRLARRSGEHDVPRIVPFRGDYHVLRPAARDLVRGLLYPVPDPRFPFLGVHFTRRVDGEVWAGPNAVLAFARDGYRRRDVRLRDLAETVTYAGFWRLARPYLRTGLAEQWRDLSRSAFAAALRRYVPELRDADLEPGPSGVRAQALRPSGELVDDFVLGGSGHVLHVLNAPSPAATACLAIGRVLAETALERFELRGPGLGAA
ncbi:MAG TPA: L-2-hydroxyglutarate oxidase [Candidatus Limnocylindrales bacterium]